MYAYVVYVPQVLDVTLNRGNGSSRERFFKQLYDNAKIVPLTPFREEQTFESLFGSVFSHGNQMSPAELLTRARMSKWFRHGDSLLRDVPYPQENGKKLPHGAVLNFEKNPIASHTRRALIWWLRLRGVNLPGSYPMHPFPSPCGGEEPGLIELVERARTSNAPCMTVEQVGNSTNPKP